MQRPKECFITQHDVGSEFYSHIGLHEYCWIFESSFISCKFKLFGSVKYPPQSVFVFTFQLSQSVAVWSSTKNRTSEFVCVFIVLCIVCYCFRGKGCDSSLMRKNRTLDDRVYLRFEWVLCCLLQLLSATFHQYVNTIDAMIMVHRARLRFATQFKFTI